MNARLPTHHDRATFFCELRRDDLVEQVAREIAEGEAPLVFGIHGDWGSGKTSFLCQLANELSEQCPIHRDAEKPKRRLTDIDNVFTVWFEAWRYQYEPAPVVALLQEICRQLPMHKKIATGMRKWSEVITKGVFGAVDEVSVELDAAPLGIGGKGGVKLKNPVYKVHEAVEDWEKERLSSRLTSDHARGLLTDAIKQLLGGTDKDQRRVCVIIDDLDRCDPAAALKLLEGIRIHLSLPRCVFVLGVNIYQIQRALAPLLPGATEKANPAEQRAEAAEYLEKLCNFTWKLPFPVAADRAALLALWIQDPPGCDAKRTVQLPKALRLRLAAVAEEFDCLPANPRKIKSLANTVRQLAARAWPVQAADREFVVAAGRIDDAADALLIAASIDQFHPELLRYLQTYPEAWTELINWLNGKSKLPEYSDLAHVFSELQRSAVPDRDEKNPTAASGPPIPIYPDPVHLSVFRIHRLLREATGPSRNTVTKLSLVPFLHLAQSPVLPGPPASASPRPTERSIPDENLFDDLLPIPAPPTP